jgi:hypothetical protein
VKKPAAQSSSQHVAPLQLENLARIPARFFAPIAILKVEGSRCARTNFLGTARGDQLQKPNIPQVMRILHIAAWAEELP